MTEPAPERDLLPDKTTDEQEIGWGDDLSDDERDDNARLNEDRPPHYDRD